MFLPSRHRVVTTQARQYKEMAIVLSVLGDTFADIVCHPLEKLPTWGTDSLAQEPIKIMLGGSAANFAVHATNLNRVEGRGSWGLPERGGCARDVDTPGSPRQSCVLHTSIGSDQMGDFIRRQLAEAGVECSQTQERKHQGVCVVLSGEKDRAFVTHRGAVAEFCRDDIDVQRVVNSGHVHVAGFFNCPALAKDLPGLLAEAKTNGATCSLVPQWDAAEEWSGLDEIYPLLDVFLPNEDEALRLSRCSDVAEAASYFLEKGVGLVVITRGAKGAFAVSREAAAAVSSAGGEEGLDAKAGDGGQGHRGIRTWEQRCARVEVVDTTGAGDAFGAGFIHTWKAFGDVQLALRWGCALGSTVVTRVGGTPKLSVEEDIRPNLLAKS